MTGQQARRTLLLRRSALAGALVALIVASAAAGYQLHKHEGKLATLSDTRPTEAPAPSAGGSGIERAHQAGIDSALDRWARQNAPMGAASSGK